MGLGEGFLLSPLGDGELQEAVTQEGFILLCELSPHRTELSEVYVVPLCPQFGGKDPWLKEDTWQPRPRNEGTATPPAALV